MLITGCVCILECIIDLSATAFEKKITTIIAQSGNDITIIPKQAVLSSGYPFVISRDLLTSWIFHFFNIHRVHCLPKQLVAGLATITLQLRWPSLLTKIFFFFFIVDSDADNVHRQNLHLDSYRYKRISGLIDSNYTAAHYLFWFRSFSVTQSRP